MGKTLAISGGGKWPPTGSFPWPLSSRRLVGDDAGQISHTGPILPHLVPVLTRAAGTFEEIADWNAATLAWMASSGWLSIPNWVVEGRLSRHLYVSDHPGLPDGIVPAPRERVTELIHGYTEVRAGPSLHGPPAPDAPPPSPPGIEAPGL